MKELIIHIGFGKCASSSIQNHLTKNAAFYEDTYSYKYIGFDQENNLLKTDDIVKQHNFPPYFFTTNLSQENEHLKQQLNAISDCSDYLGIISNEGLANPEWLNSTRLKLLSELDLDITIFMVVRPFSDWLNSSWWQWGAFADVEVNEWLSKYSVQDYKKGLENWLRLPNVKDFHVVDINDDPLQKFASILKTETVENCIINRTSCSDMLRFLIKNKNIFGRTVHNPSIEFILNDELDFEGVKPPFIITESMVKKILKQYKQTLVEEKQTKLKNILEAHIEKIINQLNAGAVFPSYDFSMDEFLNTPFSTEFTTKINSLLAQREQVPQNFSATRYLFLNPDVRNNSANPYDHYFEFGLRDRRRFM